MKLLIKKGSTSVRTFIFIQDSTVTTGAGKTGLLFNTASLTCYRARSDDGNAGGTAISLLTATLGTFAQGGFKEKDATNMPGVYEFGIPDTALATGSNYVVIYFLLAGTIAPCVLEIQLTDIDVQDTVRAGLTALPNVASGSAGAIPITGSGANAIAVDGSGNVKVTSSVKKNQSGGLAGFQFVMTDSTTHNPKQGLGSAGGVTPTISKDGGAFGSPSNTVNEISNGVYYLSLSQTDLNANTIMLRFTAANADDLNILLVTQP